MGLRSYMTSEPTPEVELLVADFFTGITNGMLDYRDDVSKNVLLNIIYLFWSGIRGNISKEYAEEFDKKIKTCFDTNSGESDIYAIIRDIFEYADECGMRVNFNSPNSVTANNRFRNDATLITPENYLVVKFYKEIVNSFISAERDSTKWYRAERMLKVFWCAIRVNFDDAERTLFDQRVFISMGPVPSAWKHRELARYVLEKAGNCGILRHDEHHYDYDTDLKKV